MKTCVAAPRAALKGCLNSLPRIDHLIDLAIDEDAGLGDITSRAIFSADDRSRGFMDAKQDLVVCGLEVASRVFGRVDPALKAEALVRDGERVAKGARVLSVSGPTASMLTAERTALNFVQRLSGIATLARRFADAVANTGVRIVDTRKTTPGWRALEKYAVRCGGCFNHRSSLGEHVMIKDNHIAAAGSLTRAVELTRHAAPHLAKIEVEAKTHAEVKEALRAKADVILLDNMAPEMIRRAVDVIAGAAVVEVSGGVRLETVREYALPGVDVISIGALTHSATAVDLSLDISPASARTGLRRNRKAGRNIRPSHL
jgi:nicotinate-nucleotide pyrophosphorylase (carboxylating)